MIPDFSVSLTVFFSGRPRKEAGSGCRTGLRRSACDGKAPEPVQSLSVGWMLNQSLATGATERFPQVLESRAVCPLVASIRQQCLKGSGRGRIGQRRKGAGGCSSVSPVNTGKKQERKRRGGGGKGWQGKWERTYRFTSLFKLFHSSPACVLNCLPHKHPVNLAISRCPLSFLSPMHTRSLTLSLLLSLPSVV